MTARLPAHLLVSACLRTAGAAGGFGAVLARGDRDAGALLLVTHRRGEAPQVWERRAHLSGQQPFVPVALPDETPDAADTYWHKRRARDPDLWVIELDIDEPERLVAQISGLC